MCAKRLAGFFPFFLVCVDFHQTRKMRWAFKGLSIIQTMWYDGAHNFYLFNIKIVVTDVKYRMMNQSVSVVMSYEHRMFPLHTYITTVNSLKNEANERDKNAWESFLKRDLFVACDEGQWNLQFTIRTRIQSNKLNRIFLIKSQVWDENDYRIGWVWVWDEMFCVVITFAHNRNSHLFNVIIIILAVLSQPESLKNKIRFIDLFTGFSMLIAFLSRSVYTFLHTFFCCSPWLRLFEKLQLIRFQ